MLKTVKKDENDNSATDFDSFKTSTPNKKTVQCEECINRTQCTDCFVRQDMMTRQFSYDGQNKRHRVHFSERAQLAVIRLIIHHLISVPIMIEFLTLL